MPKFTPLFAIALCGSLLAPAAAGAQQKGAETPTLTVADYFEIQQLVHRYAHAIDTCNENGKEYARLYTPDGAYISQNGTRYEGPEKLIEVSCGRRINVSHLSMNLVIDPAPGGATGKSYLVLVTGQGAQQRFERLGVGYEDFYVKTPEGWRFKTRHHVPTPGTNPGPPTGRRGGQPAAAQPPADQPPSGQAPAGQPPASQPPAR